MAITRVKPAALDLSQIQSLSEQAQKQEIGSRAPKSTDPAFPVFEPTPGAKYLVYVPNHIVLDEEGKPELRMDRMLRHTIKQGKNYTNVRSIQGLVIEGTAFDGSDPIEDEGLNAAFEYAKVKVARDCLLRGLNPEDRDNEEVKKIRSGAYGNNMEYFQTASERFTFPIVVIEAAPNDKGRLIPTQTDGSLSYNVYWYTVGERTYAKTWAEVFEALDEDDVPDTIGGGVFELSYGTPDEKGNAPSVRDAHKDFKPVYRKQIRTSLETADAGDGESFSTKFDKETEAWTPLKAMEVVVANQLPDPESLRKTVAEIVEDIKVQTAILESGGVAGAPAASIGLDALTGGGQAGVASVPAATPAVAGLLPEGATDQG